MKKDRIMGTKKWIYWVSIGTVLIVIYKFFDNFSGIGHWVGNLLSVLAPFLAAILIAYILYQPVTMLENLLKKSKKIKKPRTWAILVVYLLVGILIFFLFKFIIPEIIESVTDLVNNVQNYYNSITTNEIEANWAPFVKDNILKPMVDYIQKIDFKQIFKPEKIGEYLSSAIGIFKAILDIFIALICSIRILSEKERLLAFIRKVAKSTMTENGYKKFDRYFTNGNQIFFKYFASQIIDGIVVAVLMSIALLILKVKYAVLLGFIIGLFNLIPYFGAIFAVIVAALITILTGGFKQAIIVLIVMCIIQQIDANIINPRITSSKLNVSPLLIVFSVTVGGAYFGVIGMFLAVPVGVLLKLMFDDYLDNKQQKDKSIKDKNKEDIIEIEKIEEKKID